MAEGDGAEDPLDGLVLDESFVHGASVREPSAEERRERLERMRRIEEGHRRLQAERAAGPRPARPPRRWTRPLVVVVALGFVAAVGLGRLDLRSVAASSRFGPTAAVYDPVGSSVDRPPTDDGRSEVPLGVPPAAPDDDRYGFIATQPDSSDPVAHDPCRPVTLVVDRRTAPIEADALLQEAIGAVEAATGLRLRVEGSTDEEPSLDREPVQKELYDDRWAPVLVSWTDSEEISELGDDAIGLGGGSPVIDDGGDAVFVTGLIYLDGPAITDVLARPEGRAQARAVIMHELGHMLGLDHVDDPSQLMHGEGHPGITDFGAGDRAGLARLGAGQCFPDV